MRECNAASDAERVCGINRNPPPALGDFNRLQHLGVGPPGSLPAQARLRDEPHKRESAPIHDGQLEVVQLSVNVVHIRRRQRREQMLDGGNQDAFLHQARGVAYPSYVFYLRFYGKPSRSERLSTTPVLAGAGNRRRRTSTPVCSPTPDRVTGAAMVCW